MKARLIITVPRNEDGTPKHGLIKVSENKPEWGSVMVTQTTFVANNGIVNERKRTSYFRAELKTLKALESLGYLAEGADLNASGVNQIIARKETYEPQYEGHQPKVNPSTGEVILVNGRNVYLNDYVAPASTEDILISEVVATPVAVTSEEGAIS